MQRPAGRRVAKVASMPTAVLAMVLAFGTDLAAYQDLDGRPHLPGSSLRESLPGALGSAQSSKRVLSIDDYDRWRSIADVSISDDGIWIAYAYWHRNAVDPGRVLYVVNLDTGARHEIPGCTGSEFSDDSAWLACRVQTREAAGGVRLLRLDTGQQAGWESGEWFGFAPGELLAYTVDADAAAGNGVYLRDLRTGTTRPLDNDARVYSRLRWDADGRALAVLKGRPVEGMTERENVLVAYPDVTGQPPPEVVFDPAAAAGFPESMVLSERGELSWSADLARIFFGIKEQTARPPEAADPDAVADVDVWHWRDERIQSVQMVQAEQDRSFTFRAVLEVSTGRFVRLTDGEMRSIAVTRDGNWGIGRDARAYVSDWKEPRADYYRVDIATGARHRFLEAQVRIPSWVSGLSPDGPSPDGRHFVYWKDGHFWTYEIAADAARNLTASAAIRFVNEQWDYPFTKPPYGIAGWTKDGSAIVLHSRYDVWLQPLDGSAASNLTGGVGAESEIRFRTVRTDPDERLIDLDAPVLLSAFGRWSKKDGFYELRDGRLEQLRYEDASFGWPLKAKNTNRYVLTRETFVDFPDLWAGNGSLADLERITDANPWQSEYRWGRRILFEFTNSSGVRLQGTLAIPDGYRPGERRPMLVNFYEKSSQSVHWHLPPRHVAGLGQSLIEAVSKGYLVMEPDVHFNIGSTHADMLDCVEAATRKVIEMGYADPDRIGLHGHSFSGQGAVYIAGNSDLFAAVAAGAAATDLTGDFNRFWGWSPTNQNGAGESGHRYDIGGQGRLATNPFDDPGLYRRESPITYAPRITTPLLMMHGGNDATVGVMGMLQLYNAMRFNGNSIIALLYPGEGHGLRKRGNRRDLTIRMQQFFDHHLLGEPAPRWMVEGVPFLEKLIRRLPR